MNLRALFSVLLLVTAVGRAQSPHDQARFLAGLPVSDDQLAPLVAEKWWQDHAAALTAAWDRMDRRQLVGLRGFMQTRLPELHGSKAPVLYFFGGPDFLYAHSFFPKAATYILCGIEPIGALPDVKALPTASLPRELASLRVSLNTMLKTHYFVTKDMRLDLGRARLGGTLPVLYFFLARMGCTIREVELAADHVRIEFKGGLGKKQTLYYYKTDLSNGGGNDAFLKFCAGHAPAHSLVKSASYLMHGASFSEARDFLLQNTRTILQDDTGIPFRFFDPKQWEVRLHGAYFRHGDTFGKYDQADLEAAFQNSGAQPLGFSFGYHWQKERGLLIVAKRK
jgi:hypothetical protein